MWTHQVNSARGVYPLGKLGDQTHNSIYHHTDTSRNGGYMCPLQAANYQTSQAAWEEGGTSRVTVPVGGADPDGFVRVPVMVVNVPAGGVAGFAEAATTTAAGCKA